MRGHPFIDSHTCSENMQDEQSQLFKKRHKTFIEKTQFFVGINK